MSSNAVLTLKVSSGHCYFSPMAYSASKVRR